MVCAAASLQTEKLPTTNIGEADGWLALRSRTLTCRGAASWKLGLTAGGWQLAALTSAVHRLHLLAGLPSAAGCPR